MISNVQKSFSKEKDIKILTPLNIENFLYNKNDKILVYQNSSYEYFYLFIETSQGLYRFVSSELNKKKFMNMGFSKKDYFIKTKEYSFKVNLIETEEFMHYKENFSNILKNTKELRLKKLLNKTNKAGC